MVAYKRILASILLVCIALLSCSCSQDTESVADAPQQESAELAQEGQSSEEVSDSVAIEETVEEEDQPVAGIPEDELNIADKASAEPDVLSDEVKREHEVLSESVVVEPEDVPQEDGQGEETSPHRDLAQSSSASLADEAVLGSLDRSPLPLGFGHLTDLACLPEFGLMAIATDRGIQVRSIPGCEFRGWINYGTSVGRVAVSNDGAWVCSVVDGEVIVEEVRLGAPFPRTIIDARGPTSQIAVALLPDDGLLIVDYDGVQMVDLERGEQVWLVEHEELNPTIAVTRNGSHVACGTETGSVIVVETESGQVSHEIELHPSPRHTGYQVGTTALSFLPGRFALASCGTDGTLKIVDLESGWTTDTYSVQTQYATTSVSVSPDGKLVAAVDERGTITVFGESEPIRWERRIGNSGGLSRIAWLDDLTLLSSTGTGLDVYSISPFRSLVSFPSAVRDFEIIEYMPDGETLLTASNLGDAVQADIVLWDTKSGVPIRVVRPSRGSGYVLDIAIHPSGHWLAIGLDVGGDAFMEICSIEGDAISEVSFGGYQASDVMFSVDGKLLACAVTRVSGAKLFAFGDGGHIAELASLGEDETYAVEFFQHDSEIATAGNGVLMSWNASTFESSHLASGGIYTIAISPDDTLIAHNSGESHVRLLHLPSGSERFLGLGDYYICRDLEFSPDGKYLALAGGTPMLWSVHDAWSSKNDERRVRS